MMRMDIDFGKPLIAAWDANSLFPFVVRQGYGKTEIVSHKRDSSEGSGSSSWSNLKGKCCK